MQLLAIALYNAAGDRQIIRFRPGELNVITGISKTGKSALLDIFEFCLGRSTITMPVGPISDTVAWYGLLVQLAGGRAFVGRPAGRLGAASSSRAMLEFGADLDVPWFDDLEVNADAATVREQLGRLIGIDENRMAGAFGMQGLEANLGHAVLLCLQGQGEVANRNQLFHRQNEENVARAIQDTLPYFLGAWPADQALKRQELTNARRALRRAQAELTTAERLNQDIEVGLRSLLDEAYAQGLVESPDVTGRGAVIEVLRRAVEAPSDELPLEENHLARARELERQRDQLRRRLRELADDKALLDDQRSEEADYQRVVNTQIARLQSLDLLGSPTGDATYCAVCGSELPEPDPTAEELRTAAEQLAQQLSDVEATRPRRQTVLAELNEQTDEVRQQLRTVEGALAGLTAAAAGGDLIRHRADERAFTRGRIDQYLSSIRATESDALRRLQHAVTNAERRVAELEAALDPERVQDELTSRLAVIGNDMTRYAHRLELEHTAGSVRLDLARLTVVTDTDSGPAPLMRIGSGENWVGYHIAAHLALHGFFTRRDRPVPRLLMLDQPTQVFYPSDVEIREGVPAGDETRATVRRLYELLRDFVAEFSPHMQLIVCDHANLPEEWFQTAVRENWRDGRKLIPDSWIDAASASE
ncbi:MAG: DUF3732 domain-containing protein [Deltaproteobacteria bacterium]|nr:DUF3732 domain-containing protein [Deltaproteobacteria bacterium]